jgi:hypothetical protein
VEGGEWRVERVLKWVVTYDGGTTVESDGVYGKGDEIVRIGGVLEAVHDIGKRTDMEPIPRTVPPYVTRGIRRLRGIHLSGVHARYGLRRWLFMFPTPCALCEPGRYA